MQGYRDGEHGCARFQVLDRHDPPLSLALNSAPFCARPAIRDAVAGRRATNRWSGIATRKLREIAPLLLMLFAVLAVSPARAQSTNAPVVITPPIVNLVDDNHVSLLSGRTEFSVPAVKLGDVAFAPYAFKGTFFQHGGLYDNNYGQVVGCSGTFGQGDVETPLCAVSSSGVGVQAQYGEERETFFSSGSGYLPQNFDGSTFVDNVTTNGTCTWTKRDGTKIVYAGYHQSGGSQICLSFNVLSVTYPDGRTLTNYYYGSFNQSGPSPLISVTSNTGYMLKYNYSGTPAFGMQTSVTAINRAFETCDPTAVSCSLQYAWPTATLTWQLHTVSPCDGFYQGQGDCTHTTFTVQDAAHRSYVFELDSTSRVISYQPPEATSAVYSYTLCSQLLTGVETCCPPPAPGGFDARPLYTDLVSAVTRNGQTWSYSSGFSTGAPPGHGDWSHSVTTPLGTNPWATGNATPGTESLEGPTDSVTLYDGTKYSYQRDVRNAVGNVVTPAGLTKAYAYDNGQNSGYGRGNLTSITETPIGGGTGIVQTASYPESGVNQCADIVTCNKPISATDANGHETDFTYDQTWGGLLTETDPAGPNGIRPQKRFTYVQRNAWYLNSLGVMTRDPNPVWLLATESICRTTAASGSSCTNPNDQVVMTYDYGPDSGPNNLILRGKTVTADGQTLRTCYGHDRQGNKIWDTSPNANPASCPAY